MDNATALPYTVEPMQLSDLEQVIQIERLSFSAPWSERAYRFEITQNDHSTLLVVRPALAWRHGPALHKDGWSVRLLQHLGFVEPAPILGYAGAWLLVDEIHVSTIAVHPQRRGRGLGELLLISLLDRGADLEARLATLEVRVSNLSAQALYHKLGFEIVSRQRRYYSDNNEDAYIMATPSFETTGFQTNLEQCRSRLYARLQGQLEKTGKEPSVV